MAATRSNTSKDAVTFFSSMREKLELLFKKQLLNYKEIKNDLKEFSSLI